MKYRLISLYLYLTGWCNLNCKHCWIEPSFGTEDSYKDVVPLDVLEKTITEAKDLGLATVKLTGGEPFLREDIMDLISMLMKKQIYIQIETNGTLLTDDICEKLSQIKRLGISISLDGFESSSHDEFRGVKGAFKKTVEGAGNLKKHGIGFQVIYSVYKGNLDNIEKTMAFSRKIGATSFKVNPITPCGRADKLYKDGENLSITEILEIKKKSTEYSKQYGMPVYITTPTVFNSLEDFRQGKVGGCRVLNILGILSDGTVSFCGVGKKEKDLVMGNIKSDSIKDIWEDNPVLKKMREDIPHNFEGLCGKCMFKYMCLGECAAITYSLTGSFTKTFWMCEMAEKEGLFPANRLLEG